MCSAYWITHFATEFIDVGGVKGSVEHMSIRKVRSRHHRATMHTVAFGEVIHLTDQCRD